MPKRKKLVTAKQAAAMKFVSTEIDFVKVVNGIRAELPALGLLLALLRLDDAELTDVIKEAGEDEFFAMQKDLTSMIEAHKELAKVLESVNARLIVAGARMVLAEAA